MTGTNLMDSETAPSDPSAESAAIAFARSLAASWARDAAGVLGIYLIGSLAHGGFCRRYSDVDVALILDSRDTAAIEKMRSDAKAASSEFAAKLSLFWTDREFSTGRFPLLDRIDYLDHAVPIAERERVIPSRPSLDEVRTCLRGDPFSKWARAALHFAGLDALDPADNKHYLRCLLYPARFAFTWMTGRVASNDDAVTFLSGWPPSRELNIAPMEQALECRRSAGIPETLFAERTSLLQHVEFCERLIASG